MPTSREVPSVWVGQGSAFLVGGSGLRASVVGRLGREVLFETLCDLASCKLGTLTLPHRDETRCSKHRG